MFERLAAFWQGRVYFSTRGGNPALFLNKALQEGIPLFHIQKSEQGLRAQVSLADFLRLRKVARASRVRVKILAKYGWPFIAARWWKRKGLIAGIIVIAAVLGVLSQMVLFITVSGNKTIPSEEILKKANELGLKRWVWNKDLDVSHVASSLQDNFPDAAWVGITREGTHYAIKVVEKTRPSVHTEAGNLVAAKAGIVQDIMVIQGIPRVHEGQTVRAGQVLIAEAPSLAPPAAGKNGKTPPPAPAAKGFVRGRVWYGAEAQVPLVEDKIEKTGRLSKGFGIKIGSRVIMVTTPESPYPLAQKDVQSWSLPAWRNWRFPVELISIQYQELQQVHLERSQEEARKLAEDQARAEIQRKLTPGVQELEERVRVLSGKENVERIRVETETYEDLAVYPNP